MINGIVNVYKSEGFTSFDVVAKLRGIFKQKKIGHTGTLDPDATGVLPVCLGNATKVCGLLTDREKTYETVMLLGITTDTQDTSGSITDSCGVSSAEDEIREAVFSFLGEYDQIPPMYSAKKVGGKKLCDLAREGISVERKPCRVTISDIRIEGIGLTGESPFEYESEGLVRIGQSGEDINAFRPWVHMTVTCSKGTYIRTLCHDIGEKLGCGAAMAALKRTKAGPFSIDDAIALSEIEKRVGTGDSGMVKPVDSVFAQYPELVVKNGALKGILNGNKLPADCFAGEKACEGTFSVYDENGTFYALYRCDVSRGLYVPQAMFLP